MKKIFLLLISFLLFFSFITTFAEDNSNRVFKIESYEFDELTNSYDLVQYRSSVLVDKNLIYTNAHVVLDENNEPI